MPGLDQGDQEAQLALQALVWPARASAQLVGQASSVPPVSRPLHEWKADVSGWDQPAVETNVVGRVQKRKVCSGTMSVLRPSMSSFTATGTLLPPVPSVLGSAPASPPSGNVARPLPALSHNIASLGQPVTTARCKEKTVHSSRR
jgi:hypothetical protein